MPLLLKTTIVLLLCFTLRPYPSGSLPSCASPATQGTGYEIPEARMTLTLPNQKWKLATHSDTGPAEYVFKREPITDSSGRQIIPAIMVYVEDAEKYQQDVTLFSITKSGPFLQRGVKIDQTLIQSKKEYPLTYKNAFFIKASYTQGGLAHILYMIHIINKGNKGIQVYLDMTKELEEKYGQEFWTTIRSIRESTH
jgi:hypothetical protein